ncbi:MAG: MFS transporter [Gammaproteobacteria bacterium]|jgi:MFS family permease|nr:MFS transporter [Gammaproteobacteria bacterium]
MTRILSSIFALLLSTSILLTGHGLQMILGPLLGSELAFSELEIGYTGSAYYAGFIAGCLFIPRLIHKVGHIRVFLVLISLATVALLMLGVSQTLLFWILARALSGVSFSGLYMIIESWLSESAPPQKRGLVLSIYSVITLFAISVGQMLITLELPLTSLVTVAAILFLLSTLPVGLTNSASPQPLHPVTFKFSTVFNDSRIAIYGALVCGLVTSGFWALGPIIAKALHFEANQISIFMAVTLMGGAIFQLPIGRFSDLVDRRLVIAALSGAASLITLSTIVLGLETASAFFIVMFLFGGATFPLYSISLAHANDNSTLSPIETGSVILLTYSIGAVVGPVLISATLAISNLGLYFITTLILAPFSVWTFLRSRAIPATQAHFTPYQDVPVTTQEVILLSTDEVLDAAMDPTTKEPSPTAG